MFLYKRWRLDFYKITSPHMHWGIYFSLPLSWLSAEGVLGKHNMFAINTWMMWGFFLLATMLLLWCFSWEETFGWLSTAYVRLSANTSLQSSASCCHSSRCAHQLNPLSCGWAGRQVSGRHLRLQLSVFPRVPALPHSPYLTFTRSSTPLHVEIQTLQDVCILRSHAVEVYKSFKTTHSSILQSISSSAKS